MKGGELALAFRSVYVRAMSQQHRRDFDVPESSREVQGRRAIGCSRANQRFVLCQQILDHIGTSCEGGDEDVRRFRATSEEHLDRVIKVDTQLRRSTTLQVFDIRIGLSI